MTSFTSVFGGTTIRPSDVSWDALTFLSDVRLVWPLEATVSGAGTFLVPRLLDCNATAPGLTVFMPDARQASLGDTTVFNNLGANTFVVADTLGGVLINVNPATVWLLYLIDNGTPQGAWRAFQLGASVSQAQAAALAGAGLIALGGTLARSATVVATSTTPYNLTAASRATVVRWTGGAGTLTIDPVATLGTDWLVEVRNDGSGNWTIDPSGVEQINGAATLTLGPGDSCEIHVDGLAFYTVGLGRSAVLAFDLDTINIAGGPGTITLSGSDLNRIGYKFTGLLTGNQEIDVPNTIQQYWVDNSTTGAFSVTIKTAAGTGIVVTQGTRAILYCDGTNVVDADTAGIATPIAIAQGGTGATTASGARSNLGSTATGDALFTAASATAARATLGSSVVGDAVFIAVNQAAALTALGASGLALANAFTNTQTVTNVTLNPLLTLVSTDGSNAENVGLELQRNGGSPANNDLASSIRFTDFSAAANKRVIAKLLPTVLDVTDTSEDAELAVQTIVAGTTAARLVVGQGLRVGAPTDGDMGLGWVNVDVGLAVDGLPAPFIPVSTTKSAAYNVAKLDCGKIFRWTTAGFTATLNAATRLNGFIVGITNDAATGDVTITPAVGTINGVASITVPPGYGVWVQCDGTNYVTVGVIQGPGIPIGRVVASVSATLDLFFLMVPTRAREINFSLEDLVPTASGDLWLRTSTDGSTFDAVGYTFSSTIIGSGGGTAAGPVGTNVSQITASFNNPTSTASTQKVNLYGRIRAPRRTARPMIEWDVSYPTSATAEEGAHGRGFRITDHSIDGVRALFNGTTIASGALEAWWN